MTGFEYPGRVGLGIYDKHVFESNCEVQTKEGVKTELCKMPTEFALETGVDIKDPTKIDARGAIKMGIGKKYTIQSMLNHEFKLTSAFSFTPKKGFKFIWSDQTDIKRFVNSPKDGFGYLYGFTVEFDFDAF